MASRKMVLMNLFAGQQCKRRHKRTDLWTQWGKERGDKLREEHGDIYMIASGNLLCAKGAQLCDKGEGWAGDSGRRGRMCACG